MDPATLQHKILSEPPGQFVSALAHEIRNPLTNINLSAHYLETTIPDADIQQYIEIIKRNSLRINNILNDLLAYHAEVEEKTEIYSIHQLLDEVTEMAADRTHLKNILIRKQYSPVDCRIEMNCIKMKIALTNIIVNAIESMNPERGELTLLTRADEESFTIQIEDNGSGISKLNLKEIFKPYFTTKKNGLGIGLASTYDILQSNHVGVIVESVMGEGTRFILRFDKKYAYKLSPE